MAEQQSDSADFTLIIPAAGKGTRMRRITGGSPKELLLINGKALIHHTLLQGLKAGIKRIIIIINRDKEDIRFYFEKRDFIQKLSPNLTEEIDDIRNQCVIFFKYQETLTGEADAIALVEDLIPDTGNIAVFYPDNFVYSCSSGSVLRELMESSKKVKADTLGLIKVKKEFQSGYSNSGRTELRRISDKLFEIKSFSDKGKGAFQKSNKFGLRRVGIFVSGHYFFEYIRRVKQKRLFKGQEFCDYHVLQEILNERPVYGLLLPAVVFDVGNPKGYNLCLKYLKEKDVN